MFVVRAAAFQLALDILEFAFGHGGICEWLVVGDVVGAEVQVGLGDAAERDAKCTGHVTVL